MIGAILFYDGIVNIFPLLESMVGQKLPWIGTILGYFSESSGGIILPLIFSLFYGRWLYRNKHLFTLVMGLMTPFFPTILPLTTISYLAETKILSKDWI